MKDSKLVWAVSVLSAAAVMGVIFWFSGQPGEESHGLSTALAEALLSRMRVEAPVTAQVEHFLRKLAHFVLYFVLGLCLGGVTSRQRRVPAFWLAVLAGLLFAVTDELHQVFSQGRTPQAVDVLIDTCGTAAGAWLLLRKKKDDIGKDDRL